MHNQSLVILTLGAALLAAPLAQADRHFHETGRHGYTDYARVVNVEPIYRTVSLSRPHRECWQEEVAYPEDDGVGDAALGMIVGGVIGGALGHNLQHDGDTGKIAGAVIGSAIGHDVATRRHRRGYRTGWTERCTTVQERYSEERLDGYRVTYRYKGHTFTTRMDHDPGRRLRVRVNVLPLDD